MKFMKKKIKQRKIRPIKLFTKRILSLLEVYSSDSLIEIKTT